MSLHMGWTPDAAAVDEVVFDPSNNVYAMTPAQGRMMQADFSDSSKPPVILFDALRKLEPSWTRGAQGIGDCVSWGWELGCTLSVAVDITTKSTAHIWQGPFATEPIYGGARVEARGIKRGGYSDGAVGAYAAKFVTQWGALNRHDYSKRTANLEHNLTNYDAKRAKEWGNFGCGGAHDKSALDELSKTQAVKEAPQVISFADAAGLIENGIPVVVCSDQGFADKRDKFGFVAPSGIWYHCMVFAGVRYDRPGLLLVNSWGNSWGLGDWYKSTKTGDSMDYWPEVQKCSSWVDSKVCDRMLRQQDSYGVTGVHGLKKRSINWAEGW